MPDLVPGIYVLSVSTKKTWMAGASPAMTKYGSIGRYVLAGGA
jgi:hypothetical protein